MAIVRGRTASALSLFFFSGLSDNFTHEHEKTIQLFVCLDIPDKFIHIFIVIFKGLSLLIKFHGVWAYILVQYLYNKYFKVRVL